MSDCTLTQDSFYFILYISKLCTYSTVWLLYGWYHIKLLPSLCTFCEHHTTMHHFTVSLHSKPHTYKGACVFRCNLSLVLLAKWPGSFTCYCDNTRVVRISKLESAQKVDPEEEIFPLPFGHESGVLPLSYPRSPHLMRNTYGIRCKTHDIRCAPGIRHHTPGITWH